MQVILIVHDIIFLTISNPAATRGVPISSCSLNYENSVRVSINSPEPDQEKRQTVQNPTG